MAVDHDGVTAGRRGCGRQDERHRDVIDRDDRRRIRERLVLGAVGAGVVAAEPRDRHLAGADHAHVIVRDAGRVVVAPALEAGARAVGRARRMPEQTIERGGSREDDRGIGEGEGRRGELRARGEQRCGRVLRGEHGDPGDGGKLRQRVGRRLPARAVQVELADERGAVRVAGRGRDIRRVARALAERLAWRSLDDAAVGIVVPVERDRGAVVERDEPAVDRGRIDGAVDEELDQRTHAESIERGEVSRDEVTVARHEAIDARDDREVIAVAQRIGGERCGAVRRQRVARAHQHVRARRTGAGGEDDERQTLHDGSFGRIARAAARSWVRSSASVSSFHTAHRTTWISSAPTSAHASASGSATPMRPRSASPRRRWARKPASSAYDRERAAEPWVPASASTSRTSGWRGPSCASRRSTPRSMPSSRLRAWPSVAAASRWRPANRLSISAASTAALPSNRA